MIIICFEGYVGNNLMLSTYKNESIELDNILETNTNEEFRDWFIKCYNRECSLKIGVKLKAIEIYP